MISSKSLRRKAKVLFPNLRWRTTQNLSSAVYVKFDVDDLTAELWLSGEWEGGYSATIHVEEVSTETMVREEGEDIAKIVQSVLDQFPAVYVQERREKEEFERKWASGDIPDIQIRDKNGDSVDIEGIFDEAN